MQGSQLLISDLCNFTIYIHAQKEHIEKWFKERFNNLKENDKQNESIDNLRIAQLSEKLVKQIAEKKWLEVNRKDLKENIYPTLQRAQLVIEKAYDHSVQRVRLRKL